MRAPLLRLPRSGQGEGASGRIRMDSRRPFAGPAFPAMEGRCTVINANCLLTRSKSCHVTLPGSPLQVAVFLIMAMEVGDGNLEEGATDLALTTCCPNLRHNAFTPWNSAHVVRTVSGPSRTWWVASEPRRLLCLPSVLAAPQFIAVISPKQCWFWGPIIVHDA